MLTVGSLFSGIGGLDLGLERAGMSVRWQCEIEPDCRAVLGHHWPGLRCYEDIRDIDGSAERVDLICGGFPCQPVSLAGKGLAQEDPRWLWPEFARVVGDLRPRYVLVENVPGLVRRGLADVIGDLAEMGYDAEWQVVSVASVDAPHLRERLFVVAYPGGERRQQVAGGACRDEGPDGRGPQEDHLARRDGEGDGSRPLPGDVADPDGLLLDWGGAFREDGWGEPSDRCSGAGDVQDPDSGPLESWRVGRRAAQASGGWWWATEPDVGRVAHGAPNRLAQLRALGNAVVPQVAEFVGRLILEAEGAQLAA